MDRYIGKKLEGRYEIRELIGVGGMANVYKAYDLAENKVVAVKILREEYMNNEEFLRRFRNESRAISLLSHANIVRVYDVIFTSRIQSIVMEYIDGVTLKDYIDQEGVIRWKEAVHFSVQILKALQHAHDKGIVHRDIKPQNIMLLSDGTIKITDFGIARFSRSNTKTITDKAIGSVHYISPEQASGAPTDARTDLYSLGVLMFEMLTGKLPFEADSPVSVAIKQIQTPPIMPRTLNPNIPKGLEEVVMKSMQKDAGKRYQSAAEMLMDIDQFKRDPSIVFSYKYEAEPGHNHREVGQEQEMHNLEEQRGKNKKKKNGADQGRRPLPVVPVLAGIAFAFLLAAGAFIAMLFVVNKPFEQKPNVTVPDFVGLSYETIKSKYADNKTVKIKIESQGPSSEYGDGVIYEQSPVAGKTVKQESTVKIKVSTGQEVITLADYKGKDSTEAFRELGKLKLKWTETPNYSNEVPSGQVVKTAPGAGEAVTAGDTITVYVSIGSKDQNQAVPLVEGMNFHEAKTLLTGKKLRINVSKEILPVEGDTSAPTPGTILDQTPNADALVPPGTTIDVTVAGGDGWEDPNKKREVKITFDLPEGSGPVHIQTIVDGVETGYGDPNLATQHSWTTKPAGKGDGKVEIHIDGAIYKKFDVNFDTGVVVETTDLEETGKNLASDGAQDAAPGNISQNNPPAVTDVPADPEPATPAPEPAV